jgi:hypothetical protein
MVLLLLVEERNLISWNVMISEYAQSKEELTVACDFFWENSLRATITYQISS